MIVTTAGYMFAALICFKTAIGSFHAQAVNPWKVPCCVVVTFVILVDRLSSDVLFLLFRTSQVTVICSKDSRLDFVSENPQVHYVSVCLWLCNLHCNHD